MNVKIQFSEKALASVNEIIARYPADKKKSALIPVLHIAQAEFDGWLSAETMDYVASILEIKPIEVYEVASFYSMFNLKPVGKCLLEVCRTSSCWLMGAEDVVRFIENKLNIKEGETTADGKFTLKTVECLGACGYAPMMQVGDKYYEFLTLEKTEKIIDNLDSTGKRSTYNGWQTGKESEIIMNRVD